MKKLLISPSEPGGSFDPSRRSFLGKLGIATAVSGLLLKTGGVLAANPPPRVHWIGESRDVILFNTNTRERLETVFYAHGRYNAQSIRQLCHLLRDHHRNVTHPIDPELLTMLADMQCVFDKREIHIVSAYRTPQTNAGLQRHYPGVAKDSYHMKGKAVDLRIPGIETRAIRDVARVLAVGGVGYYPRSRFVHIDTGPERSW